MRKLGFLPEGKANQIKVLSHLRVLIAAKAFEIFREEATYLVRLHEQLTLNDLRLSNLKQYGATRYYRGARS